MKRKIFICEISIMFLICQKELVGPEQQKMNWSSPNVILFVHI